jgi:hypothetical protein
MLFSLHKITPPIGRRTCLIAATETQGYSIKYQQLPFLHGGNMGIDDCNHISDYQPDSRNIIPILVKWNY